MTPLPRRTRRVVSHEVDLHVIEVGERGKPPLLLVHGFPDTHEVYAPLLDDLGRDYHVATFDMRGVGQSTAPAQVSGYRIASVLPDITAVIDAVFGPDKSVHLVAHDWGSVLAFSYVTDPLTRPRVRSFTSVSGPHLGLAWSDNLRNIKTLEPAKVLSGLGQLASSWYTLFFHLPVLPEWLFKKFGDTLHRVSMLRGGVSRHDPYVHATSAEIVKRVEHAIELYRQNVLRPPKPPRLGSIDVPLSLVIPLRDPFVRPQMFTFIHDYATDLNVYTIDASHWMPRSHPGELAQIVRALVARVESKTTAKSKPARDDERTA